MNFWRVWAGRRDRLAREADISTDLRLEPTQQCNHPSAVSVRAYSANEYVGKSHLPVRSLFGD